MAWSNIANGESGSSVRTKLNNLGSSSYVFDNILGTVSQSGGVPTGAIIETGTNTNGRFIRFADGTQICTSPSINSSESQIAFGNLFWGSEQTWTFPAAFVASPNCFGAAVNDARWLSFGGASSTSVAYRQISGTSFSSASPQRVNAIGRWY